MAIVISPKIRVISPADTLDIRQRVLWPMRTKAECALEDDESGIHLGGFVNTFHVSVMSLFETEDGWRIRKFATLTKWQGKGIGKAMLGHAVEIVRNEGGTSLWCHSRLSARKFYSRHGLEMRGDIFQKYGSPYIHMECSVKNSFAFDDSHKP